MDWFTHTMSAIGGGVMTGVPLLLWAWRQSNAIRAEKRGLDTKAELAEHELDKVRESDAYQSLKNAMDDMEVRYAKERVEAKQDSDSLCQRIDAQAKKIEELQEREISCLKKTAMQDVEIYKLTAITQFQEQRIKVLETTIVSPPTQPAPASQQGAIIAAATKEIAKEAIAETPKG